jgi:uncharacterized protein (TIGR02599 family)
MKKRQQGWTLVEVLVSTSILALLVIVMAEALNTTQRSWLASRTAADRQQTVDSATSMVSRQLRQATLQPRASYDSSLNKLVTTSDLHFVSGPAAELMTGVPGVCGDAVFFQHPAADGSLQRALQACGFFVQYGGDEAWRPPFLSAVPERRRFRLLQFHQPASSLTLFQSASVIGEPSRFSQLTSRSDLYSWFVQPISDAVSFKSSVSVVAENVVAMIVQTSPVAQRCYDSRRYQWEAGSAEATRSRHELPETIDLTLVMTDEARWARLSPEQADALAIELKIFIKGQSWQPDTLQASLNALQQMLESNHLNLRITVISVATSDL